MLLLLVDAMIRTCSCSCSLTHVSDSSSAASRILLHNGSIFVINNTELLL